MGLINSLLKWGFLSILVLVVPWCSIPVGIYFAWKFGLLRRSKLVLHRLAADLRIRDKLFKLNASNSMGLIEKGAAVKYYVPCNDSPYALIPQPAGFLSISAFVIRDASGSPANYKKAINEAVQLLSKGTTSVVLTLGFAKGSEVDCKVLVAERCLCKGDTWIRILGEDTAERGAALIGAIQAIAPSIKVRMCRGDEILRNPMEGVRT